MNTNADTTTEGADKSHSSQSPCSIVWDNLDDEFEEIADGRWAVIHTADGWEIESQHSGITFKLESTDMESAKIEGEKLARQIENRFL